MEELSVSMFYDRIRNTGTDYLGGEGGEDWRIRLKLKERFPPVKKFKTFLTIYFGAVLL